MNSKKFSRLLLTFGLLVLCLSPFAQAQPATMIRWDIARLDSSTNPPSINSGGQGDAGAISADGSIQGIMTVSGSGTFLDSGDPAGITGGGTWSVIDASTDQRTSGSFSVEALLKYNEAPGTLTNPNDNIGNPADARAGLAILLVAFDDGSEGTLTISARFDDTSHMVVQGISVTKDFVDFSDMRGFHADQNMTIFHIQQQSTVSAQPTARQELRH